MCLGVSVPVTETGGVPESGQKVGSRTVPQAHWGHRTHWETLQEKNTFWVFQVSYF